MRTRESVRLFLWSNIRKKSYYPILVTLNLVTRIEINSSNLVKNDHFIEITVHYIDYNLRGGYSEEVEKMTDRSWIHMLKKWTGVFLGALLVLALAACGDDKEDQGSKVDVEKPEVSAEEGTEAEETTEKADAEATGEASDMQIGVTAEEFQKNFNTFAEEEGIPERVDNLDWRSSGSEGDHEIIDMTYDEDRRMQLLAKKGEEEVRGVMFSMYGDRKEAFGVVRSIIRGADPSASDEEVDGWMEELHFSDPETESTEDYHFVKTDKFNLLAEDSDTYIEFVISNVNDPEINAENFEAGEL